MSATARPGSGAAYSIAAMRGLARGALPRPVFDFADGGGGGRAHAAAQRGGLRRCRAAAAAAERRRRRATSRSTLFGKRLSLPVIVGPTGLAGPVLAGRRALRGARRGGGRHGLLPQPRLGLHAGGARRRPAPRRAGCRSSSTATAASRASWRSAPRRPATTRSCSPSTTSCSATASATSATASPSRRASAPRRSPAWRSRPGWLWRMRGELKRITFGNYVRPGEAADIKRARRPHGVAARSLDVLGRRRRAAQDLDAAR